VRQLVPVFLVPLLVTVAAQDRPLPDFNAFTAQVKTHLTTDEERQSGYMFIEKRTEQRLDDAGRTTDQSISVFEVYPGLPGQDRYRRLIQDHGKPVSPDTLAKNDRKRQQEVEAYARQIATTPGRQKETQQLEKDLRSTARPSTICFASTTFGWCVGNRLAVTTPSWPR
jgi:DNA-binding transcriptional regulator/RsmH inhibitor MraZ